MHLTILGSGSFLPHEKRNCSGYLLDIGDETLLLDGGSGTLRQMVKAERSVLEVGRVFYSHFHLDHTADFLPLLFTRKYYKPQRPNAPLYIHAHPDFAYYFDNLTKMFEKWTADPDYPTYFSPITPGMHDFSSYQVQVFPSNHAPESQMYRFIGPDGESLLYTGDVGLDEILINASRNVDLLLIECGNLSNVPIAGHLNPEQIKTVIEAAQPERVILTHLPPEVDNLDITERFGPSLVKRITIAEDFLTFDF